MRHSPLFRTARIDKYLYLSLLPNNACAPLRQFVRIYARSIYDPFPFDLISPADEFRPALTIGNKSRLNAGFLAELMKKESFLCVAQMRL